MWTPAFPVRNSPGLDICVCVCLSRPHNGLETNGWWKEKNNDFPAAPVAMFSSAGAAGFTLGPFQWLAGCEILNQQFSRKIIISFNVVLVLLDFSPPI